MTVGYIGLGKMGLAMVARLLEKKYRVVAWNRSEPPREEAKGLGAEVSETISGVCEKVKSPRLIWLMVPHAAVDDVLKELISHLSKGDTVIDGGNSFYKHSMRRASSLARRGVHFLDVGVSGGPSGARHGACLMIGGEKKIFKKHEQLFQDLAGDAKGRPLQGSKRRPSASYLHLGKSGAGHFVKMVHNGIEYGMMQSLAEGFTLLRSADKRGFTRTDFHRKSARASAEGRRFGLNLKEITRLYNRGSVIESRLIGWLSKAFEKHGEELLDVSGEVAQSGEGLWTVETANELGVPVEIIKKSLEFRLKSKGNPSFTGKVVSALRNQFGGHQVTNIEATRKKNTEQKRNRQ